MARNGISTLVQGRWKIFMTGQAKLYSEHYVIKYLGGRQYCNISLLYP